MTSTVSAVVLNWNKPNETIACAESVLVAAKQINSKMRFSLVIIDNGSDNESVATLRRWLDTIQAPEVTLLTNPDNLGFAGGMNVGIRALAPIRPDYFWLLNNDLVIDPNALAALVDAAETDPCVAIWGPTILDAETGKVQCAGGCRYQAMLGLERPNFSGKTLEEALKQPTPGYDYIYGAAMLLKGELLSQTGGLDERHFLYYEEMELALTLPESYSMRWCKEAIVHHAGSKSHGRAKAERVFTAYHAALSAYRFTWRHYPWYLVTVIGARVAGLFYYAVRDGNPALAWAPIRALVAFFNRS